MGKEHGRLTKNSVGHVCTSLTRVKDNLWECNECGSTYTNEELVKKYFG